MEGKTRNFTYDANGNLLSDGKYTYSWTKGSLLEKVTGDGLEAVYTYDASGIRTSKKVNGTHNGIPDSGRQCPVGEEERRMAALPV